MAARRSRRGAGQGVRYQFVVGTTCTHRRPHTGTPFAELLKREGILVGIKVDKGVVEIPGTDGETITTGLDELGKRCQRYYAAGARFAKW